MYNTRVYVYVNRLKFHVFFEHTHTRKHTHKRIKGVYPVVIWCVVTRTRVTLQPREGSKPFRGDNTSRLEKTFTQIQRFLYQILFAMNNTTNQHMKYTWCVRVGVDGLVCMRKSKRPSKRHWRAGVTSETPCVVPVET